MSDEKDKSWKPQPPSHRKIEETDEEDEFLDLDLYDEDESPAGTEEPPEPAGGGTGAPESVRETAAAATPEDDAKPLSEEEELAEYRRQLHELEEREDQRARRDEDRVRAPRKAGSRAGEAKEKAAPSAADQVKDVSESVSASPAAAASAAAATTTAPSRYFPGLRGLNRMEMLGLAGIGLVVLIALIAFRSTIKSQIPTEETVDAPQAIFKSAVRGEWLGIESIDTYWREPRPGDRIKSGQALIPEARVTLLAPATDDPGVGFVKVVFRSVDGKVRGDVTPRRVAGGQFAESGATALEICGTEGLPSKIDFAGYASGSEDLWTAEVFEGKSYDTDAWNRLAYLTVAPQLLKATPEP